LAAEFIRTGFIAQEVALIPELVPYVNVGNETELWSVNYTSLFTYAVAGLKELDAIVSTQASLIKKLEERLYTLENK
jgi:hypothetical protein